MTSVLAASSSRLQGVGGRYFENCNEAEIIDRNPFEDGYPVSGVARYALDPDNASLLWEISTNLTRR